MEVKEHNSRGRVMIAQAILMGVKWTPWLRGIALDCIINYREDGSKYIT